MNVSVIIPALNSAETLSETLDSLRAQSNPNWEAVVVDDGSSDGTAGIVERFTQNDSRIRLIKQPHAGVGAARNHGIREARFDWLLFLDADDWISPVFLERMTGALIEDPDLDVIACNWVRLDSNHQLVAGPTFTGPCDLFDQLATQSLFIVHSCLLRRSRVVAVGGFDPSFRTNEDWDLWQRIARTGARFGRVDETLATYRMRPGSATSDLHQMMADGLRVISQGHGPDPRVPGSHPSHAQGLPPHLLPAAQVRLASVIAGLAMGQGQDPVIPLRLLKDLIAPDLDPYPVAREVFGTALQPISRTVDEWIHFWPQFEPKVKAFLAALEDQSRCPGIARRAQLILERMIFDRATAPLPLTVGMTQKVRIEVTQPLSDIIPPAAVERLYCVIEFDGMLIGTIELPVCDGLVSGWVLADAIASELAWKILGRFFEHGVYQQLRIEEEAAGRSVWRGDLRLAGELPPEGIDFWQKVHDRIGWTVFLQELWGRPHWSGDSFYDPAAADPAAGRHLSAKGWIGIEAANDLPEVKIPAGDLEIAVTVGGAFVGAVSVPGHHEVLSPQTLRAAVIEATDFDICIAAVREGVIGRPMTGPFSLRQRLADAATEAKNRENRGRSSGPKWKANSPLSDPIVRFGRRDRDRFETSASRRATFPIAALPDLIEAAEVSGEPILSRPLSGEQAARIVYDPDRIVRRARTKKRPAKAPSRSHPSSMLPDPAARILWPTGFLSPVGDQPAMVTDRLPILMYHRIAADGSAATAPYRVAPEIFEEQLRYLRIAGYYSIRLEDWRAAMSARKPLPGRAVLITFDDGYLDFFTAAWPLLKKYGFSATVFLVTGGVGRTNDWDRAYDEILPLMGWPEIRRLSKEGVEFGSHSVGHQSLTALTASEIVHQAARSRALLQQKIGSPIRSFAYPYGSEDAVIQHLIGACGYVFGLTCRPGRSHLDEHHLLALPRIDVNGSLRLEDFPKIILS